MDQVEEIKSKIDIVDLVGDYLPLKKAGRNFTALCPFHDEKTPSFMVSPELQIYKCFGCGAGGDAIKFLQEYEKIEFWEALEILAKRAGVKLNRGKFSGRDKIKKRLYKINHLAAEFYHFILTQRQEGHPALEYLTKRGITPEIIEEFKLGFSPSGKNAVVKYLVKKGFSKDDIRQTGLTAKGRRGDYERFHSRIIFPLYNHRGDIVGFSGRTVPGISRENIAKYINIPNTLLYQKGQSLYGLWLSKKDIRQKKEAVVVEGEFDLISPYQAGVKNIVAIKGTAFTPEQAKLINRYAEKVIFFLDADAAGGEAVKRSAGIVEKEGLELEVAVLPEGFKDPDDLAREKPKQLKKVLKKTESVYDYVIDRAFEASDARQPTGQRKILKEVLPFINQMENAVIKQHYFKKVADKLGVSLESVITEASKNESPKPNLPGDTKTPKPQSQKSKTRRQLLEEQLFSQILSSRNWEWLDKDDWQRLITNPRLIKIVKELNRYRGENEVVQIKDFFNQLPEELKPGFEEIYLIIDEDSSSDDNEIRDTVLELTREDCRIQLTEIANKISDMEKSGKSEEINELEKKFVEISQKLSRLDRSA